MNKTGCGTLLNEVADAVEKFYCARFGHIGCITSVFIHFDISADWPKNAKFCTCKH